MNKDYNKINMTQLYGLHEALIDLHNSKMMVIAELELVIRILSKKSADEIVGKIPLKAFAGAGGYETVTAMQMTQAKQAELDAEYKVLATIKEMIQEGGMMTP
jgi:hypothetical protein